MSPLKTKFGLGLSFLVVTSCGECDIQPLELVCEGPCHSVSGLEDTVCAGHFVCEDNVQLCIGSRDPETEICNNIDDDCDGEIDEDPAQIVVVKDQSISYCPAIGDCEAVDPICAEGQWICPNPPGYGAVGDPCDGHDNDCDGETDEDPIPEEDKWVYTGPIETLNVGECRAGYRYCDHGKVQSPFGMVVPRPEKCGDFRDNDCDGAIDEVQDNPGPENFLVVMDESGSMQGKKDSIISAICDFGENDVTGSLMAVVGISIDSYDLNDIEFDFVPMEDACISFPSGITGGGTENMLESMNLLTSLSETPTHVIFFTDEGMQIDNIDQTDVVQICGEDGFETHVFTYPGLQEDWESIVDGCGGSIHDLSYSAQIEEELEDLFQLRCDESP